MREILQEFLIADIIDHVLLPMIQPGPYEAVVQELCGIVHKQRMEWYAKWNTLKNKRLHVGYLAGYDSHEANRLKKRLTELRADWSDAGILKYKQKPEDWFYWWYGNRHSYPKDIRGWSYFNRRNKYKRGKEDATLPLGKIRGFRWINQNK